MPALISAMAMPPPMVPAPITAALPIGRVGVSVGYVGNMRGSSLGLEHMAQRCRLGREHQRAEQFALALEARIEGLVHGRRNRLDAGQGSRVGTGRGFDGVARELKKRLGVRHGDLEIARAFEAAPLGKQDARELQRGRQDVLGMEGVEQSGVAQLLRGDGRARHDHVQRPLDADQARQALRAAGARQEAQLDLRQRDLRARDGHAVMTGQSQFETAAHTDTIDAGNHGLAQSFDRASERGKIRLRQRLGPTELADVGAAGKALRRTHQNDCLDGVVRLGTLQRAQQCAPQFRAETVHRRIVEREDRDAVGDSEIDSGHRSPE